MGKYILEVCVDSAESALAAVSGGADRLELCAGLVIGGITPDVSLYEKVRELTDTRIHVLIRPRYGDFLYTDYEFEIISRSVELYRKLGADGVVVGCLLPDGSLDQERMKRLKSLAGDMNVTLHRAFDMCRDPYRALEQAKETGIGTILTSGQKESCSEGMELLAGLVKSGGGQVDIMAGGGTNHKTPGACHGSYKLSYVRKGSAGFHHDISEGGCLHGSARTGRVPDFPNLRTESQGGQAGAGRIVRGRVT